MLSFIKYLIEATSMDDELLGHLTHTKDIPHEAPSHVHTAIDLIRQFHNLRQGQSSTVSASLKHDGKAAVHIIHEKDSRVGVTDKHKLDSGIVAYSDEDGTAAVKLDGHLPEHEVLARREAVSKVALRVSEDVAQGRIGQQVEVLIEESGNIGRSRHQGPEVDGSTTIVSTKQFQVGSFIQALGVDCDGVDLIATEVSP